jgi:hypothetical protein
MKGTFAAGLAVAALLGGVAARAEQPDKPAMTASLINPEKNAARGWATVEVKVSNVTLTDPAAANEIPKPGQAHLHYQLDDMPVVATIAPKLSFHDLKPGEHKLTVMLAANDHSPLGPKETLTVRVTRSASN